MFHDSAPLRGAVLLEIARKRAANHDLVGDPLLETAVALLLQQPGFAVVRKDVRYTSLKSCVTFPSTFHVSAPFVVPL